jgi:acylphosphatase
MERVHLIITGRVQGVFFRHNTNKEANRLGLTGWVRNLPTGEVEAVAEGEKAVIEEFISWCRHGPSMARVDDVTITWETHTGEFSGFTVTY